MSGKKYAFFMMAKNPIFFAQPMSKQFVTASTCKKNHLPMGPQPRVQSSPNVLDVLRERSRP